MFLFYFFNFGLLSELTGIEMELTSTLIHKYIKVFKMCFSGATLYLWVINLVHLSYMIVS